MKLEFIDRDKLFVDKTNMRFGKKIPDVSDMLPTVRKRGILQPLIVRPANPEGRFGIVAGRRRWTADATVTAQGIDHGPLPCAILEEGDDADAIEASLIENLARLDPDEVTQWDTFTRLVKEGRTPQDIAETFGLPDLMVRRVLALGNLLPRVRALYASEKIDRATVRHLTLASKSQQRSWLALFDDPEHYVPTGHQLKAWLFGGQSIPSRFALFDMDSFKGAIVSDLFGEDRYFADADAFWTAQNAAIAARQAAYLDDGWSEVVIVPPSDHFSTWEYEKASKRKGGRVYVDIRASGEVTFHEGYLTRKEAQRIARGGAPDPSRKAVRPELTSTMQAYVDLHRHAAVRAALLAHPSVALRLMVAHAIGGSHLWRVSPEPQSSRNDAVRESVETCRAEAVFDERRRAILAMLGFCAEEPTVVGSHLPSTDSSHDDAAWERRDCQHGVAGIFLRLVDLPDHAVMEVMTVVMGETLASGSAPVAALGLAIGVDMADWWEADTAFFESVRDRQVLTRIVAEVAGEDVASANAGEKTKSLKRIVRDHLDGVDGRTKVARWVPRWMTFPATCYTARGGVGTVAAHRQGEAAGAVAPDEDHGQAPIAKAA